MQSVNYPNRNAKTNSHEFVMLDVLFTNLDQSQLQSSAWPSTWPDVWFGHRCQLTQQVCTWPGRMPAWHQADTPCWSAPTQPDRGMSSTVTQWGLKERNKKGKETLMLTRLATFSGESSGRKNSAVRSMADCATGTAAGLESEIWAGSSLSSSSSFRAGSACKCKNMKEYSCLHSSCACPTISFGSWCWMWCKLTLMDKPHWFSHSLWLF